MPLLSKARRIMRINLEKIRDGKHPPRIEVGSFTQVQLYAINQRKLEQDLPTIIGEITFIGRHIFESRIEQDGYTIEDVLDQICSAMEPISTVIDEGRMTGLRNPTKRTDRYGKQVNDVVVFECYAHRPNPHLYGTIPKGDGGGPKNRKGHLESDGLFPIVLSDPPG